VLIFRPGPQSHNQEQELEQEHDQQEQREWDNYNANNAEAARSNCSAGNGLKKLGRCNGQKHQCCRYS